MGYDVVAIIQIKPETELSYLTVFVAPKCRRKGIGTMCVDYAQSHALCELAFHEMRVRVGDFPDSAVEQASEKSRIAWNEDFVNRFVYRENNEIVGFGHIEGNELGSVSVRVDMQGRGIGKKLVMYLCNEIYSCGYDTVVLWCVVGNYARELYDNLGFHEKFIAEFPTKTAK